MIRRLMLIFGSIVLAAIAFLTYLWWQSPVGSGGGPVVDLHLHPTSLQTSGSVGGVGTGEGVWINQYDKDGNPTSTLRAKKYLPRASGSVVDVIEPQAEFFLSGGRRMVLDGDRGVVNVEKRPGNSALGSGAGDAAPTSGFLYNVVIRIYEPQSPDHASLTLTTNNISFDNQTFKFATESFTDSYGQLIHADMVPVQIRGDDVDFDGKGLNARYDDLNQRIALLQITHGDTMTVKRADMMHIAAEKAAPTTLPVSNKPAIAGVLAPLSVITAGNQSPTAVVTPAPITEKPAAAPVVGQSNKPATTQAGKGAPTSYRATFLDNVRVTQGDAPLAEAEILAIDFFPAQGKNATTRPTTKTATKPKSAVNAVNGSHATTTATQPLKLTGVNGYVPAGANGYVPVATTPTTTASTQPTTAPTTQASTLPTTAPAAQPVPLIVHWTGTLRLVAIEQETVVPLLPGESALKASGSPLVLHQPQGVVHCGSMLFHSRDNGVTLSTSEKVPEVTFVDTAGQTTINTQHVTYSDATKTAVLSGASKLHMVQPKQGIQPATDLTATWNDKCVANLFADNNAVRQIDLTGDVDVNHPQLKLKSQALSLAFKPGTGEADKSELESITAAGQVDCDLSTPLAPNRMLKGEKVVVGTVVEADGRIFPHVIDASGSVQAADGDQSMTSDSLQATLVRRAPAAAGAAATKRAPAGAPVENEAQLETFHANGSVVLLSKEAKAMADEVTVDQTTGKQVITLRGKPASLSQQGRTITGPVIIAQPDDGLARVEGAGTLHAIEASVAKPVAVAPANKPAATQPAARPIDMSWTGGADFDGPGNLITFRDNIEIQTVDADGTRRVANSNQLTVSLKPAPEPAKKSPAAPADRKPPTTAPAGSINLAAAPGALKDKVVSAVNLLGNVRVQSTLESPAGVLARRTLLQTEKLTANLDDAQQISSIDIPVPGQALIDDRKSAAKPVAGAATKPVGGEGGATAVEWKKSFHMDEGARPVATLTGEVHMHHDPLAGPGEDSVDLQSSKVIVTFKPAAKSPATKPAIQAVEAPAKATNEPALNIKEIYAAAPVVFRARDVVLNAQTLDYTPDDHMVLVSGTDRQPATWFDGQNRAKGQFQQVWYNAQTQEVEKWTGITVQGGK